MTTFYLIRHAEALVVGRVLVGRTNVHLSDEGHEHARRLARQLARASIHRIVSSPRERTRETAAPLAEVTGLSVEIAAELDEVDFGEWTGKTVDELEPDPHWQRMNQFRTGVRIPGGERLLDVQARMVDALLRLHEAHVDHVDQSIAVVSHREPIQLAVCYFAGAPLDLFSRFEIAHCSVTTLTLGPSGPTILGLNDTGLAAVREACFASPPTVIA